MLDTAGRLAIIELMNEVVAFVIYPAGTETLLVVDAMTGQDTVNTAKHLTKDRHYGGFDVNPCRRGCLMARQCRYVP